MREAYSIAVFKRTFKLPQQKVNELVRRGIIEVQQSGFKADSMHHHKLIVVKDESRLQMFLDEKPFVEELEPQSFPTLERGPPVKLHIGRMNVQKIGTNQILRVNVGNCRRYINLSRVLCAVYKIKKGDLLRVQIVEKFSEEEA